MSTGWSENDKAVAKAAAERARRRAHEEAMSLFAESKINHIDDLWALEQHIRKWRKEREGVGIVNYATANEQFAQWLAHGWLQESDLTRLSPERLAAIQRKLK